TDESFAKLKPPSDAGMYVSVPRASEVVADRDLQRRLSGDLDNILVRALEADPQRRYESAAVLADDLRRHLLDQPILARPQKLAYKVGKFARRNRVQIAAAAVIILLWAAVNFASRGRQSKQQPQAEAASLYRLPAGSDALIGLRESTAEVRGIMESRAKNTL